MISIIISQNNLELGHDATAQNIYYARTQHPLSTREEKEHDWYSAIHVIGRDFGSEIFEMITGQSNGSTDLEISENIIPYLEDVSLESCKDLFAWHQWDQSKIINSDEYRIKNDWFKICDKLGWITKLPRAVMLDDSVLNYLKKRYIDERKDLVIKKAFWMSQTFLKNDPMMNYHAAEQFVKDFYNIASGGLREIGTFVMSNSHIVNLMEVFLFRLRKIVKTTAGREISVNTRR